MTGFAVRLSRLINGIATFPDNIQSWQLLWLQTLMPCLDLSVRTTSKIWSRTIRLRELSYTARFKVLICRTSVYGRLIKSARTSTCPSLRIPARIGRAMGFPSHTPLPRCWILSRNFAWWLLTWVGALGRRHWISQRLIPTPISTAAKLLSGPRAIMARLTSNSHSWSEISDLLEWWWAQISPGTT